jgi:predicted transposase YbfD/YdcC
MMSSLENLPRKSRVAALLEHFGRVEDPRDVRRILHPLPEVLFLVVCGTIADCDDYEDIAAWGAAHLGFLRRHLPYEHGVPGERWLSILMNRINPALFAAAFADGVRESWPEKAGLVAIDGKTSRRSHDRRAGVAPLHLVSAFATTARLVLAQEAVPDKANELAAIPPLLERLGAEDGLKGALVSIDAIATNPAVAEAIAAQGADWLLAVKANQPSLRAEVEAAFAEAGDRLDTHTDLDKGHGRIEARRMSVLRETDWLDGARRFPGEPRLPGTACPLRAETRVESRGAARTETRYFISSRALAAADAAEAVRGHWGIENRLRLRCSTSPSPTTSPASARATAPETRQPSGTSPPISSAPPPTGDPSNHGESSQDGIPTTSTASFPRRPRNLDSEPWRPRAPWAGGWPTRAPP